MGVLSAATQAPYMHDKTWFSNCHFYSNPHTLCRLCFGKAVKTGFYNVAPLRRCFYFCHLVRRRVFKSSKTQVIIKGQKPITSRNRKVDVFANVTRSLSIQTTDLVCMFRSDRSPGQQVRSQSDNPELRTAICCPSSRRESKCL